MGYWITKLSYILHFCRSRDNCEGKLSFFPSSLLEYQGQLQYKDYSLIFWLLIARCKWSIYVIRVTLIFLYSTNANSSVDYLIFREVATLIDLSITSRNSNKTSLLLIFLNDIPSHHKREQSQLFKEYHSLFHIQFIHWIDRELE